MTHEPDIHPRPIRAGLISLGCAKNLVDAEHMLGILTRAGIEITGDVSLADVVVVNTCAFIDPAKEESIDAILESDAYRDGRRRGQALVVAGCLPQRFRDALPELLPEVDAFMGIDQVPDIERIVRQAIQRRSLRPRKTPPTVAVHRRPVYIASGQTPRFRLTPPHFAYVKIAEGCNHPCSFCVIPRIRGTHRSRPLEDIVRQARDLLAQGVREINLISQDTTCYGLDPGAAGRGAASSRKAGAPALGSLLRALNALPGEFWIRLLYTHPAHWTDGLIRCMAECRKVARYVDMPLQHIHPAMLDRMRRETSREYLMDLIARLRAGCPGLTLRTTFLVGFPGETREHFAALLEFIRTTRFDRLGVFAYSREEGTRAARMRPQVPEAERQRRLREAMAVQREVAREISAAQVGRTLRVLVEGHRSAAAARAEALGPRESGPARRRGLAAWGGKTVSVARSAGDAPEIDGRVYVQGDLPVGEFVRVRVVDHTDYDLFAVTC